MRAFQGERGLWPYAFQQSPCELHDDDLNDRYLKPLADSSENQLFCQKTGAEYER